MAAAYRMIPPRFKRVSAAFEDIEVVRARICESTSGSEHSGDDGSMSMSMDLSHMVNSFMERGVVNYSPQFFEDEADHNYDDSDHDQETKNHKLEEEEESIMVELRRLMGYTNNDDPFKKKLLAEIERQDLDFADSNSTSPEVKRRRLMAALRERGFDAGVCKSKWENSGKCPPGSYEYIDVNGGAGTRYIIEVNLSKEFSIAHPTDSYDSLLSNIPFIFVGKFEELKRAVRLLSNAMKHSMQQMNMSMPPWRRRPYLHAKWFGSYRRTTNEFSQKTWPTSSNQTVKRRSVGFGPVSEHSFEPYSCRNNLALKGSGRMGQLALAFNNP